MSIFINGKIITLSKDNIAEAFKIKEGKFVQVGTNEQILALKDDSEKVIDLKGRTIVPGFIDSHMHFLNYAVTKSRVDLSNAASIEEIIEKTQKYISENNIPEDQWIISRGWNHNLFKESRLPCKDDLDKISTKHPIFFSRVCGHIGVANSMALDRAGINFNTVNPEGGIIDKTSDSPTGILRENALNLIFDIIPAMRKDEIKKTLLEAFKDALSVGLTSIYSEDLGQAGSLDELLEAYRDLDKNKELPLRFVLQLNLFNEGLINHAKSLGLHSGLGGNFLKIGPVKLYQDGSLGGRTAAMERNYMDVNSNGVVIYSQEELNNLTNLANSSGFQVVVHAIGDRAINMVLDSFENFSTEEKNLRPVIIHCQFTNQHILRRFKNIGAVANIQPSFVMTDWPVVDTAVEQEVAEESYAWKDFLNLNVPVSFSSDAPIESFNPLWCIYAAVTRKNLKGNPPEGWHKEQCVSVMDALRCFTLGSAYMNFDETLKGSIEIGKLADFVVLDRDILSVHEDSIKDIKVLETYIEGKRVFSAT